MDKWIENCEYSGKNYPRLMDKQLKNEKKVLLSLQLVLLNFCN